MNEDIRTRLKKDSLVAVREVITHERDLRALFESSYQVEIDAFHTSLGVILRCLDRAETPVIDLPRERAIPQVMVFLITHRCVDDMLAAYELFSCGFLYAAKNMMRSAAEAYATAVLVSFDPVICDKYRKGHWDVAGSLNRLRRRKDLPIPIMALDTIIAAYPEWSKNVHPTFAGIRELSPKKGQFIGGFFHQEADTSYRIFLKNIMAIANSVVSFLNVRFLEVSNPLYVQRRV